MKTSWSFLLFFICISIGVSAQTAKIDSLKELLTPIKADTSRIHVLISLSQEFYSRDLDLALQYCEESLSLSKDLIYTKGVAESQFQLGKVYAKKNLPRISLQYYADALKNFIEIRNKARIATVYNNVGIIYKNQALYDQALEYYEQAFSIYKEIDDDKGISNIFINIGVVYRKQGKYEKAIENYYSALKYTKDTLGIASVYGNLGNMYNDLEEYDNAVENYNISKEYFKKIGKIEYVGRILNNTGNIFLKQNEYNKALSNYEEALDIHKRTLNKSGLGNSFTNIGKVYVAQDKYYDALGNFEKAIAIYETLGERGSVSELNILIGKTYLKLKFYDQAFQSINEGIRIAQKIQSTKLLKDGYEGMFMFYELNGNYQKSLEYYKLYTAYKDSLFNIAKDRQIKELEILHDIEDKRKENAILIKDREVRDQQIRSQKFQNIASIVALVFIMAFALYLYQNYKDKQQTNNLLTEQNEKLNKRRQQIVAINENLKLSEKKLHDANEELQQLNENLEGTVEERTQELKQANQELDTFLYQSSHALRRPIAQVKGLIQLARMENGDYDKVEAVYNKIDDTSTRMDLMLKKLVMASEINLVKPTPERINFRDLVNDSWNLISSTMDTHGIKLDCKIGSSLEYIADPRLVNIIFHNLLENAVLYQANHRHREGMIGINVSNGESTIKIDISDNGIGISQAVITQIFDLFSIGTDKTKGYGLGLYIVKKAVERLEGDISVESKEHEFTSFHVKLPQY